MIPAVAVARGFGRIDMLSILFHAEFGMGGATIDGLESEVLQATLCALVISLTLSLLAGLWRLPATPILAAAAALLAVNPVVRSVAGSLVTPPVESDLISHMAAPALRDQAGTPPDLVLIYLEGTDRQFADRAIWGDLYGPLDKLAAEGVAFTNVMQIAGTGWSLAGMVASQCGVPVLPRGLLYRNNFDRVDRFMPALTCLGDILAEAGYAQSYVVGGDTGFGGIDVFYRTHRIDRQIGMAEQSALYRPAEIRAALAGWVLDDQMVFETARTEFTALAQGAAPLHLIVETIGPHGQNGILSRRCHDGRSVALSRSVTKVVSCLLDDTAAFVRFVQQEHARHRPGRELRVVILSDHLSHNPALPIVGEGYAGTNTVLFLGGPGAAGRIISKPGAMIDIFPTLLEWMGLAAPPAAAGLGKSLFGDQPTLAAHYGRDQIDRMIVADVPLSRLVWGEAAFRAPLPAEIAGAADPGG
jgi:phosphoglycerol transferase